MNFNKNRFRTCKSRSVKSAIAEQVREAITRKKAQIEDAKGWIGDLKELNGTQIEFARARHYVRLLENDLKKLEK